MIFLQHFCYSDCLEGFLTFFADISGRGLTGVYDASEGKCATDCNAREECGAFEYSRRQHLCKLVEPVVPDASAAKYHDFMFCSKQGEYI